MNAIWVSILLAAPVFAREPVGHGEWDRLPDPVHQRLSSLLVGDPLRNYGITIVPIHARVPSEAGHGRTDLPRLVGKKVVARPLFEDGRWFLRVVNDGEDAVFLPAGLCLARAKDEFYLARDTVIKGEFAAIVPGVRLGLDENEDEDENMAALGFITPELVASIAGPIGARHVNWTSYVAENFRTATERSINAQRSTVLVKAAATLLDGDDATIVGAAFFIGATPVAAHVFADTRTFLAALPGLLQGVALQEVRWARFSTKQALVHAARQLDGRARTLGILRRIVALRGASKESHSAGTEVLYVDARDGFAQALLSEKGEPLHIAYYRGGVPQKGAPARPAAGGGPPAPPAPPNDPNGPKREKSNGEMQRTARPTAEEERVRARRPQLPGATNRPSVPGRGGSGAGPAGGGVRGG